MSGRVKHEQRSHKTRNKNYSEFNKFKVRAYASWERRTMRKTAAETFVKLVGNPVKKVIKKLFTRKKQDR